MGIRRAVYHRRVLAAAFGFAVIVLSALPALAQQNEPIGPKLTPKLQGLLQQEMVSILDASHHIVDALVMGDNARVADQARAIEGSFIMEQSMTDQDRKDLMAVLPPAFIELDRLFHQTAANLATEAARNNRAQVHTSFNKMIETCGACHEKFATDRFPEFAGK